MPTTTTSCHYDDPALGEGIWFLALSPGSAQGGTYESNGLGQMVGRTGAIDSAALHCP